jgi:hypothetical protein
MVTSLNYVPPAAGTRNKILRCEHAKSGQTAYFKPLMMLKMKKGT